MSSSMGQRAKDRANKRKNHDSGSYLSLPEDTPRWSPMKGNNRIDILPYIVSEENHPAGVPVGDQWYQRTIFVAFDVGSEEKAMLSPKTNGLPCPIFEEWSRMRKDEDADKDSTSKLKPKERELFNIIDLDQPELGSQLWEISYHNFGKLLEEEIREADDDNVLDFASLTNGMSLTIRFREETFANSTYLQASKIAFTEREEQYEESAIEEVLDLDAILVVPSYEDLQAQFLGLTKNDSGEDRKEENDKNENVDAEKEKPKKKKTLKRTKKKEKEEGSGKEEDDDLNW